MEECDTVSEDDMLFYMVIFLLYKAVQEVVWGKSGSRDAEEEVGGKQ